MRTMRFTKKKMKVAQGTARLACQIAKACARVARASLEAAAAGAVVCRRCGQFAAAPPATA